LRNFRGSAAEAGIDLADGLLDTQVDLRLRGEDGLSMGSKTVFSHLSVSEPPGGPISSYLRLPAPLDTVLYLLRNDEEEQVIPLNVRMDQGAVSARAVASAVVNVLGQLIGEALASTPMRIVGGVLDLAGLGAGPPIELPEREFSMPFEAGATEIDPAALQAIEPLLELMRRDDSLVLVLRHEVGAADVERAARLVNPPPEARRELADRLRQRKAELLHTRDALAAEIRTEYAIGARDSFEPRLDRLRGLDRELSQCETALDSIYEMLRPGAERRADRRTRDAAIEIARLRLEAARGELLRSHVRQMPARLDVRRPRFGAVEGDEPGRIVLTLRRRR
jgi:hypothetical protein